MVIVALEEDFLQALRGQAQLGQMVVAGFLWEEEDQVDINEVFLEVSLVQVLVDKPSI